jgi:hypothetical protein
MGSMPLPEHVALVSLTSEVPLRDLLQVAAAVQKQVTRDFSPLWGIDATVDAFPDLESVPSDYRPVVLFGDVSELPPRLKALLGALPSEELIEAIESDEIAGIHLTAITRQPFSLASVEGAWPITVSHETLEMLADPYGNRLIAAAHPTERTERVCYLLEVCDPCLSTYYTVNGIPVSDFYTPRYFDPVDIESIRYSFTGAIQRPLEILEHGYLSWIDPRDSSLYQLVYGGESVLIAGRRELARARTALRTVVDTHPRTPRVGMGPLRAAASAVAGEGANVGVLKASEGSAQRMAEALLSLTGHLG